MQGKREKKWTFLPLLLVVGLAENDKTVMKIKTEQELEGMKAVSEAVGQTLREMRRYARPGMTTRELDDYGGTLLADFGAKSAPKETYQFPGFTCISVNKEIAHGIPTDDRVLREGDLINIDVSGELKGFWADNGGSFVLGEDIHGHQPLIDASKACLQAAMAMLRDGVKITDMGKVIFDTAQAAGFGVIKNLAGHGVGRSLHEKPTNILSYPDPTNKEQFHKGSVVAVETFIATRSSLAIEMTDGWTLVGNAGGYTAQHEHTLMVTESEPLILTACNGIFD